MQMQRLRACRTDSFNFNYGLPLPAPPRLLTCISSLNRNYPLERSSNFSLSSIYGEGLSSSNQTQSLVVSPQLTAVAFNEFPRLRQKDKKCDTSQLNSFHPQPNRRHRRFSLLPLPPPSISAPAEIEIDCLDAQKDGSMSLWRVKSSNGARQEISTYLKRRAVKAR